MQQRTARSAARPQCWSAGRDSADRSRVGADVPVLRHDDNRGNADRCLHLLSRMYDLPCDAQAQGRGLLRLLFVRIGEMPARAAVARLLRGSRGKIPSVGRHAFRSLAPGAQCGTGSATAREIDNHIEGILDRLVRCTTGRPGAFDLAASRYVQDGSSRPASGRRERTAHVVTSTA